MPRSKSSTVDVAVSKAVKRLSEPSEGEIMSLAKEFHKALLSNPAMGNWVVGTMGADMLVDRAFIHAEAFLKRASVRRKQGGS